MTENKDKDTPWTRSFEAIRTSPRWAGPILRAESEAKAFIERALSFLQISQRYLAKRVDLTVRMLASMEDASVLPFRVGMVRVTERVASMLKNVDALISGGALNEALAADDMKRVREANLGTFARDLFAGQGTFNRAWIERYSIEEMVALSARARLADTWGKWLMACVTMHSKVHPGTWADAVDNAGTREIQERIGSVLIGRLASLSKDKGKIGNETLAAFVSNVQKGFAGLKGYVPSESPQWVSDWIIPANPMAILGIERIRNNGELEKMPRLVITTDTETHKVSPSTRIRFANEPENAELSAYIGIVGSGERNADDKGKGKPCPDCGLVHDHDDAEEGGSDEN